jgi:hypothetical protein
MKIQLTKITLTAIATCFAFSTAFAANLPKNCTDEIVSLSKESDFDMQKFMKELVPAVVKAKLQAKVPFGKPKDSDKTDIGMTFGCLKVFPESPGEIQSLLKDVSLKIAQDTGSKMAKDVAVKKASAKNVDDEEEIKAAKPIFSSAKVPVPRIDTVKVVILETEADAESPGLAKEFKPSELRYMTQEIRRTAINYFPKSRYFIITEQDADFIIKGVIGKFRKNYTFRIEVYDVGNKMLIISSEPVGNEKVEDLLSGFYKIAPDFFKRLEDEVKRIEDELSRSGKTTPAPSKQAPSNSNTACKIEVGKARSIYDECVKMGKASSGYTKCEED